MRVLVKHNQTFGKQRSKKKTDRNIGSIEIMSLFEWIGSDLFW